MKIAFFTEMGFTGKVPDNHPNMRTEFAWMKALDADHYPLWGKTHIGQRYDLGIFIIPKDRKGMVTNPEFLASCKLACQKTAYMQEGPYWLFQDKPVAEQVWYLNTIDSFDILFAHNEYDVNYFKGLLPNKPVYNMPSLMLPSKEVTAHTTEEKTIIGGNLTKWYGGIDSFMVARHFDTPIVAPSMGRRKEKEEEIGIQHLPYMDWGDWHKELSRYKYAVHLMPTYAAGTFAMNCSFWKIPCIGYESLDTQRILHPKLTVKEGDIKEAVRLANHLKNDEQFYEHCSELTKQLFDKYYSLDSYITHMSEIFKNEGIL